MVYGYTSIFMCWQCRKVPAQCHSVVSVVSSVVSGCGLYVPHGLLSGLPTAETWQNTKIIKYKCRNIILADKTLIKMEQSLVHKYATLDCSPLLNYNIM